jgi:hypothetical protein
MKRRSVAPLILLLAGCGGADEKVTCDAAAGLVRDSASNACVRAPCQPNCDGRVCGSDGCDGSCGVCAIPATCSAGKCVGELCKPECTGRICGDNGCGGSCGRCAADTSCGSDGQCGPIAPLAPGDITGEFILLRQLVPQMSGNIFGALGKAEAALWNYAPWPEDTRATYETEEGEPCTFEIEPKYPELWRPGADYLAGRVRFDVAKAPGPIQLEPLDLDDDGAVVYGWGYYHDNVPPFLQDSFAELHGFFSIDFVPLGVPFSAAITGSSEFDAEIFDQGEMPAEFTITSPDVEHSTATISLLAPLHVTWTPPQPEASLDMFVTGMFHAGSHVAPVLLACKVKDDGEAVVPQAVMELFQFTFPNDIGVQLRRVVKRRVETHSKSGTRVVVDLVGRYARLGSLPSQL